MHDSGRLSDNLHLLTHQLEYDRKFKQEKMHGREYGKERYRHLLYIYTRRDIDKVSSFDIQDFHVAPFLFLSSSDSNSIRVYLLSKPHALPLIKHPVAIDLAKAIWEHQTSLGAGISPRHGITSHVSFKNSTYVNRYALPRSCTDSALIKYLVVSSAITRCWNNFSRKVDNGLATHRERNYGAGGLLSQETLSSLRRERAKHTAKSYYAAAP